jgi:hypothetical protein
MNVFNLLLIGYVLWCALERACCGTVSVADIASYAPFSDRMIEDVDLEWV